MADIFISYTASDRDWAFWIAHELEALGHKPHVHEWEIPTGGDILAWMEERLHTADHVLCVISKAYLAKPYSSLERRAAQWAAASDRPGFALPIFIEDCEGLTLFAHIKRRDLYGLTEDEARAELKDLLVPAEKPPGRPTFPGTARLEETKAATRPATPFPGKVAATKVQVALSNIPISVPRHFVGRDDALAAIAASLAGTETRAAITALRGLRGVGKTTLAAAYADRHHNKYRATWWIRAQTESTMRADLVGLGVRLGWVAADDKEEPALAAVLERLRHEGEGILLIYDNAPDAAALRGYLPLSGSAQVLITSNAHAWRGVAAPVEIRIWPKEIGADYLIARTDRTDERGAAEALSDVLGGLPLAHEQAAAYCEDMGIGFAEYQRRFESASAELLDDKAHAAADYHLTVAGTFRLAIDEAAKRHPAAEPLIVHAALLAPEPIPLFLFAEAREKFDEPLAAALAGDGLDKAVAVLRALAILDRGNIADERDASIMTDCIRLHRLVRQVARVRRDDKGREAVQRALIEAVAEVYPHNVFNDPRTWPRARRLDALALALVRDDASVPSESEDISSRLLARIASYRHAALAAYAEAQKLYERVLAIDERVLGPEHSHTASSLNNLALLLQTQGDFAAARPLHERALTIREKILGPEHPDTADSLNNLALLLQTQGDFAAARPLHERALTIREKILGPEHPDIANSLNNLGLLRQDQGDLAAAQPLFERALTIRKNVLGPEDPATARSLANLGRLLRTKGDLAGALPLEERALAVREKVLGPEHPETANSLNNTALLLQARGKLAAALPRFRRALIVCEKMLGPEHPHTNIIRTHLARLLLEQVKPADALPLAEAALVAHDKVLKQDHHWTKDSASVAADALDALDRGEEAAALRERYGIASGGKPK